MTSLDAIDVPAALRHLANRRPVFHSEADFRHALAWQFQEQSPELQVRQERRPDPDVREASDLWLTDAAGQHVAIELKYLTRSADVTLGDERFVLTYQSANDTRRYDVCKDIARIERWVDKGLAHSGWVIVLTNDPAYWRASTREANDADFRLHEGRNLSGRLVWKSAASPGSLGGRPGILEIRGAYQLAWQEYSTLPNGSSLRALLIPVGHR